MLISTTKCFKDNNIAGACIGPVQFVVFEKNSSALKIITPNFSRNQVITDYVCHRKARKEILKACHAHAICNLHFCCNKFVLIVT